MPCRQRLPALQKSAYRSGNWPAGRPCRKLSLQFLGSLLGSFPLLLQLPRPLICSVALGLSPSRPLAKLGNFPC